MRHDCIILADGPSASVKLCGISPLERLLRTLQRCGIRRATILSAAPEAISASVAQPSWPRGRIDLRVCHQPNGATLEQIRALWPKASEFLLVVRGDAVFDIRLLRLLLAQKSGAALVDSSVPARFEPLVASAHDTNAGKWSGAALLRYDWAAGQDGSVDEAVRAGVDQRSIAALDIAEQPFYDSTLRRKLRPFWFPTPSASHRRLAEDVLLDSAQKGSLDLPALIHAPIERFLVSHLCKTSITPHQLTIAWILVACATTILFARGQLVWGIVLALIVGILDGLDGKQARIKVETSKVGRIEHWFDSLFEFAWPTALAYHFYASGQLPNAFRYLFLFMVAEVLDAIGKAIVYSASQNSMAEPGPFDRMVRWVGGRRNIYVWVLIVATVWGAPAKALIVMAWWEVATAAIDISQGLFYRFRRGKSFGVKQPV